MNRDAAKLIADRGSGLSSIQLGALRWVATGGQQGAPPKRAATWRSLERAGLIEHRRDVLPLFGWRLTSPDGYTLAERMGLIEKPDATAGSPGDAYDPPPVGESTCDTCRIPESRWPTDHPLSVPGSGQCAWCRQADIEDDSKWKRRED